MKLLFVSIVLLIQMPEITAMHDDVSGGIKSKGIPVLVGNGVSKKWVISDPQLPLVCTLRSFYKSVPVRELRKIIAGYLWHKSPLSLELAAVLLHYLQNMGEPRVHITSKRPVNSLALAQGGNNLLIADLHTVNIWDIRNINKPVLKSCIEPCAKNNDLTFIKSVVARPDDNYFAMVGAGGVPFNTNGVMQLWDMRDATDPVMAWQLQLSPSREASLVQFNKDGTLLLSGCNDNGFKVWDVGEIVNPKEIMKINTRESVNAAVFTNDSKYIIAGLWQYIKVWDISNASKPTQINSFEAHDGWVRTLDVHPTNNYLCTGSQKYSYGYQYETAKLWNIVDKKKHIYCNGAFKGVPVDVNSLAYSLNGEFLITRSKFASYLWKSNNDEQFSCVARFNCHKGESGSVILDNERCIISTSGNEVAITDLQAIGWMENKAGAGHYFLLKEIMDYKNKYNGSPYPLSNELLLKVYDKVPKILQQALKYSNYVQQVTPHCE